MKRLAIHIATHIWTLGIMFVAGISIAGSDNEFMPWFNFVGVLMLVYVVLVANWRQKHPWRRFT